MPTRRALLKNLAIAATGIGCCSPMAPRLLGAQGAAGRGRNRRIAAIDILPFTMPMKQMMRTAVGQPGADEVLVRARTADGVGGWGEASPFPPVTGETQASAVVIGKDLISVIRGRDPFELARIVADMDARVGGNPSIKAALEMALWDICGKLAGQPVCHLLGQYRDTFESDRTVSPRRAGPHGRKGEGDRRRGLPGSEGEGGAVPGLGCGAATRDPGRRRGTGPHPHRRQSGLDPRRGRTRAATDRAAGHRVLRTARGTLGLGGHATRQAAEPHSDYGRRVGPQPERTRWSVSAARRPTC